MSAIGVNMYPDAKSGSSPEPPPDSPEVMKALEASLEQLGAEHGVNSR